MPLVDAPPAPPASLRDLRAARSSFADLVARFDAGSVDGCDAAAVVQVACEIERLAGALRLLAAPRVVQTGSWSDRGAASPARWLASTAGVTVADAERTLATADQVDALPVVRAQVGEGRLSAAQVREIADAATADPSAARSLLDVAARSSLGELRARANEVRAAAAPTSADDRHERVRRARRLFCWVDGEGGFNLAGRSTVDEGALCAAVLDPIADRLFREAHADGRREPVVAYRWDALMEVLRRVAGGDDVGDAAPNRSLGSQAKVVVRVDHAALVRGWVEGEETCDIAGLGPIPVRRARDLLGEAFLAAIVTKGRDVHTVAHLGRRATAFQRTALAWSDPTCSTEGCPNTDLLEIDHTTEWATTRHTTLTELGRPCKTCHQKRTRLGWTYGSRDPATGKRPLRPPARAGPGP